MQAPLTDIHNHLLPAVDDGAQSFEEAVRHLKALRAEGVAQLCVSPHLFGWLIDEPGAFARQHQSLENAFEDFAAACAERTDVPRLFFGQEILCQTPEIARRVFTEAYPGYRGTRYALVEFGFELKDDPTAIVHEILDTGRRMIVSHPERYRRNRIPVQLEELRRWKAAGALLQINVGSLLGDYGAGAEALAWQALNEGLADLVSTDHHADHRVASPRAAVARISQRGGAEIARLLLSENTARVLADQDLLPVPPLASR